MLFDEKLFEFEIEGQKASFSTGKLARRSQSAVFARMGETAVLVTVDTGAPNPEADFFPMSVEYIEKLYAAGKISSSRFVKRERFPSNEAILKSRMIDRSLRSRFPSDYRNTLSLTATILSYDENADPLILAINAASVALLLSKAPFTEPVSGVRISMKDGKPYANYKYMDETSPEETMNYVVSGDSKLFTMIDAGCYEVTEEKVIEGMKEGLEYMKPWIEAQKKFVAMFDVKKEEYQSFAVPEELYNQMKVFLENDIKSFITGADKEVEKELQDKVLAEYAGKYTKNIIKDCFTKVVKKAVRKLMLEDKKRVDGRAMDEIRELSMEVGLLPRVHGSGLFTRGQTQALTIVTLGNTKDQQLADDMTGEELRSYMHFYNALPFSLGESGNVKWMPGRREIGHGALAEKALRPVVPNIKEFPYTILLMSEVLSQNGSSSMASTCGSTLALMDAGVPIRKPVSGIAMGVVTSEEGNDFQILTDIKDVEDFYGDMDFKVAGTRDGVTAIQMDNKAAGLPIEVFEQAIAQAKKARLEILDGIEKVLDKPRETVSKYAPKVGTTVIPVSKIGELIGPGGKNIRELSESTHTEINVEEDGTVYIFSNNQEDIEAAKAQISGVSFVPEIGKIYKGTVVAVMPYGAFVEIAPNVSGLVHVSEMSDTFVKDVNDFVSEGQEVEVKVVETDRDGKIKLSMKAVKEGNGDTNKGNDREDRGDDKGFVRKGRREF
ncbi:MAG TPA: polyribonucleotide nucleotidyltransferase [Candidatus Dojkabacteria bacterium]|nr:polyribonucleotide nucleotidyltransferase [Candidatus Dojkabacteria bacterium]